MSTAITHLLAGDGVLRDQSVRIADGVVAVLLPAVLVGLLVWRRSAVGLIAAAAVVLIWTVATFLAFSSGIWLSAAVPVAAAAPPVVYSDPFSCGQVGGRHSILPRGVNCWSSFRRRPYSNG